MYQLSYPETLGRRPGVFWARTGCRVIESDSEKTLRMVNARPNPRQDLWVRNICQIHVSYM